MRVSIAICILFGTSVNCLITQDTTWKICYLGLFGDFREERKRDGIVFSERSVER